MRKLAGPLEAHLAVVSAEDVALGVRGEAGGAAFAGDFAGALLAACREGAAARRAGAAAPLWVGLEDTQTLLELAGGVEGGWLTLQHLAGATASGALRVTLRQPPGCDWRVEGCAGAPQFLGFSLSGGLATLAACEARWEDLPSGFSKDVHGRLALTPKEDERGQPLVPAACAARTRCFLTRVAPDGRAKIMGEVRPLVAAGEVGEQGEE